MRLPLPATLRDQRGMTLMELMVALGIWAIMGTMVAGITYSTITSQDRVLQLQRVYHSGSVALDMLKKELTMAFVSLHQAEDRRTRTVFIGERNSVLFVTGAHEPLTRNARQSDQLEVEYRLANVTNRAGNRVRALTRRVKFHIDDRPGRGGREEILIEGVNGFELEYFDPLRERWVRDWDVEVEDAQEMRIRLKEVEQLRNAAEDTRSSEDVDLVEGIANVATAAAADHLADEAQAELLEGMILPARVRIRLSLDDPEGHEPHILETQVEITMTEPLWY